MATEKQLDFFKSLFLAEEARTSGLRDTAKNYLALAAVYSAFVLFVTEKLKPVADVPKGLFATAIFTTITSFLLSLLVWQVAGYQAPSHPDLVFQEYGETEPSDADFFDNRIVDYSLAYQTNSTINDQKAKILSSAGFLLFAGLSCYGLYFILWIYFPGEYRAGSG